MDNTLKRRKRISSWKFVFSAVIVLMTTCKMTSANSAGISAQYGHCTYDFQYGDLCEVSCTAYTEIPTHIEKPWEVTSLDMGKGNHIDILTNGSLIRSKLISLQILNLEYCKIRVVEPGAFAGSSVLVHIYLNNNLITVLNPDIFTDVKSLEVLYIDNNPLKLIEPGKTFPNLTKLVTLDLSDGRLDTIPTNVFDNLESLQSLNLSGNPLKYSNWEMLRNKSNLVSLNFGGNPWNCNCYTQFLIKQLKTMKYTRAFENMTCELANIPMLHEGLEENITCNAEKLGLPHLRKSFFSRSKPSVNGDIDNQNVKEIMVFDQGVYFECKYSGVRIPDLKSIQDNQSIHNKSNDLHNLRPRRHATAIPPERLEQNKGVFKDKLGEILLVLRIREKDKGTYTCILYHKHGHALKTLTGPRIPGGINGETTLAVWKWITIFVGLMLVVFIAAVAVITWIKRGKQGEREITRLPTFGLGEFDAKSTNLLLIFKSGDTNANRM